LPRIYPDERGYTASGACLLLCLLIPSWSGFAQDAPSQPPASPQGTSGQSQTPKNKNGAGSNPGKVAAEKTKQVTVEAAEDTKKLGEAALVKARDWESSWVTGVFVPKGQPIVALGAEQRRQLYLQQTLATPGAYMKRMFAAGIDQVRGAPRQWDDGWGGYAERFASREGQFITANSLEALGNAALRYEPRYDQCRCSGLWPRTRHAVVRNFLTYDQSEQHLRPQWASYGGAFGEGLVSTAWKPHPRNAFAEGGRAMLGQAAYGALLNFFIEFAGDINHKLGEKRSR
jgi:hypothetical protein